MELALGFMRAAGLQRSALEYGNYGRQQYSNCTAAEFHGVRASGASFWMLSRLSRSAWYLHMAAMPSPITDSIQGLWQRLHLFVLPEDLHDGSDLVGRYSQRLPKLLS